METTRTEYFCDQCGKQIVTEHEIGGIVGYEPRHIRLDTAGISIQKPHDIHPCKMDGEILDFCSFRCLEDFIRQEWSKAWLDQINESREKSNLPPMKIGYFGFLERVEEEPNTA